MTAGGPRRRAAALVGALALALDPARAAGADDPPPPASPAAASLPFDLAPDGALGALVVAGPFPATALDASPPRGVDEARPALALDAPLGEGKQARVARLAASPRGALDLAAALGPGAAAPGLAYAAFDLVADAPAALALQLSVDDGVRVLVDGRVVHTRDEARPLRESSDVVRLELAAGRHRVVLKLRNRTGAWPLRIRVVDRATLARPDGVHVELPVPPGGEDRLVRELVEVDVLRELAPSADGPAEALAARPVVALRVAGGLPRARRGLPLRVTVRDDAGDARLVLDPGRLPADATRHTIQLPELAPAVRAGETVWIETQAGAASKRTALVRRPAQEAAVARGRAAVARAATRLGPGDAQVVSAAWLVERLARAVARGDGDAVALRDEAAELAGVARALDAGDDPWARRSGVVRRAIRSPVDGRPTEVGVYVPKSYRPGTSRRYPLVVALHALRGKPLAMIQWLFGFDDPDKPQDWEERHVVPLPDVEAFVVAPNGHGDALYRELGETDVLAALDWALATYPVDPRRVTITGPSMGGIGSAIVPLHHPGRFAAAAPLCGYHDMFVRSDVRGQRLRPWERRLAEERSTVSWAENGLGLPLRMAHGTRDLPVENSTSLYDRYKALKQPADLELLDAGHNVWQPSYEGQKLLGWLVAQSRPALPPRVRLKTSRTRFGRADWVEIRELDESGVFGEVDARLGRAGSVTEIRASTRGVTELAFDRGALGEAAAGAVDVVLDGRAFRREPGEPLVFAKVDGSFRAGPLERPRLWKRGARTGPLRDVASDALLVTWAAEPAAEAPTAEAVARAFARVRPGVDVDHEVVRDVDLLARGPLPSDVNLVVVGRDNRVLAALASEAARAGRPLPVTVSRGEITLGPRRLVGPSLGAAYVTSSPHAGGEDRYLAVVAGADVEGLALALALPDLVPDFVVWDEGLAPARGRMVLGPASVVTAGSFRSDWSLPDLVADPYDPARLARRTSPR